MRLRGVDRSRDSQPAGRGSVPQFVVTQLCGDHLTHDVPTWPVFAPAGRDGQATYPWPSDVRRGVRVVRERFDLDRMTPPTWRRTYATIEHRTWYPRMGLQVFGTVLRDVYRQCDRREMMLAIDDLCSPKDNILWASTGIYAFFDPYRRPESLPGEQLLYVGLARDLPDRFAAHNGLKGKAAHGNKSHEIARWFERHEHLGISLLPQSPLAQTNTSRERSALRRLKPATNRPLVDNPSDGQLSIERLEGQLIETYRQHFAQKPRWNRIGGASLGQEQAAEGSAHAMLRLLDGSHDDLLCARRPIRSLSATATYGFYEAEALHLARFYAILSTHGAADWSVQDALLWLRSSGMFGALIENQVQQITESDYIGLPTADRHFDVLSWATSTARRQS